MGFVRIVALGFLIPITLIAYQNCGRFAPLPEETGTAINASTGTAADGSCAAEAAPPPANIQTLTKLEYNNVIRDLFGLSDDFAKTFSSARYGSSGFSTESDAQVLSAGIVSDFWNAAQAVGDAVINQNPNAFLTCTAGDVCARELITKLANRAFRRPAESAEVDKLFAIFKASSNQNFPDAMKLVVRAVLISPQFVFRTYALPETSDAVVPLKNYELASRLSFFIWGSIPDDILLASAGAGMLKYPDVLESQVRRMLKDPRAKYLTKSFGRQWLMMDKFDATILDTARFPDWGPGLQNSMRTETETFIDNVFYNDQSIMDFVSAKYSFADANVAKIYGIDNGGSTKFVRTALEQNRFGILTQPAILAQNSLSNHTSPVRRGKWTLEKILCAAPGSPPANIPPLPAASSGDLTEESKIRERLEAHRSLGSSCAACHQTMDPVGLAYENYDSIGGFRTNYLNGKAVDASGRLPTGEQLVGFADLARILQNDARYPTCFTSQLMTFAEGVNMGSYQNRCTVNAVKKVGAGPTQRFSDLVVGLVKSNSFRNRLVGN